MNAHRFKDCTVAVLASCVVVAIKYFVDCIAGARDEQCVPVPGKVGYLIV